MQHYTQHQPRKRFGQHFLHDRHVIDHIIRVLAPTADDHWVEIGPGLGALTVHLLPQVGTMDAVELDRDLIPALAELCKNLGSLRIYQADALTFDFAQLVTAQKPLRIVGNLPYNISTPILFHLLSQINIIKDMHFMLQKEVVDRMVAKPGNKDYGRLSIMVQYYCQAQNLFNVSHEAFSPPPKVESAFIRLTPYVTPPFVARDLSVFASVVKQAFSQRRKMLHNSLKELISTEALARIPIDPNVRPEELSIEHFVAISNAIS